MTISVAIPLHASRKWIENIVSNVTRLPSSVERIVISDRTLADNTAQQLEAIFRYDKRVTVTYRADGLSWPAHCQQLIGETKSEYMMFMPHDDIFPKSWVPVLHNALQRHPEALLAYGRVEWVREDGCTVSGSPSISQPPNTELGGIKAVNAFLRREMWTPFRGLFRRNALLESGIRVDRTSGVTWDGYRMWDELWILSVALRGSIVFDDGTVTQKRIHPGSATFASPPTQRTSAARGAVAVVKEHSKESRRYGLLPAWIWLYWAILRSSQKVKVMLLT